MPDLTRIASLLVAGAFLALVPREASAQAGTLPKPVALCLPPGSPTPVNCGTARAGQTIRLQVATTSLPTGPIKLLFTEETQGSQAARTADVTIAPTASRDGGYDVTIPTALCVAADSRMGNFEIQHLMSSLDDGETPRRSLGTMTIAC